MNKDGASVAGTAERTALDDITTGPPRRDALAVLAAARREAVESFIIMGVGLLLISMLL